MLARMVGNLHFFVHLDSKWQSSTPGGSLSVENQLCISEHLPFVCSVTSVILAWVTGS